MCRTAFATEPTPEQRDYLDLVVGAQQTAAARLQPGATAGEVYQAAYDVFRARKLGSLLPKDIGYGVGLRQSEFFPIIEKDSPTVLQPNMVIALLQTTGYTRSVGGLRVEDTFLITPGGPERLTAPGQSG
jgi:Xaa-Pro aminopeptidase